MRAKRSGSCTRRAQNFAGKSSIQGLPPGDSPSIFTLNRWLDSLWSESWADECPRLISRAGGSSQELSRPPAPARADIGDMGLVHLLDESFEHLLRYGMDPGRGEAGNRLIEWRREVWQLFSGELSRARSVPSRAASAKILDIFDAALPRPPGWHSRGSSLPGTGRQNFWAHFRKATGAEFSPFPSGAGSLLKTLAFSDPDQEITGLMENLLASAAGLPLHEIAVVALDSDFYSPAIANGLEDILGEPLAGTRAAYNLSPDRDLAGEPLFRAALLPLRFAAGGRMRQDLFTLLRSPYYGFFSRWSRKLTHWDRIWRNERIDTGLDALLGAVRSVAGEVFAEGGREIGAALAPFLIHGGRAASVWAENLRRLWAQFEFPVAANDLDEISRQNLDALLARFENDFGRTEITVPEFTELLVSAASRVRVQKTGLEEAGIQVLGRLDARGLAFSKVFVPGLVSGARPQPVRPLPLLCPSERKKVLGGTPESQFIFARYIFGNLLASAPEITLSRPAMNREGEISLPSPFWPREREEKARSGNRLERHASGDAAGLMGPAKISGMLPGIANPPGRPRRFPHEPSPLHRTGRGKRAAVRDSLPGTVCFPPHPAPGGTAEIEAGIPPLERGQKNHEILAYLYRGPVLTFVPAMRPLIDLANSWKKSSGKSLRRTSPKPRGRSNWIASRGRSDFPGSFSGGSKRSGKISREGCPGWRWIPRSPAWTLPVAPSASREGSTGSTGARSGPYLLGLQDGKHPGKKGRQGGVLRAAATSGLPSRGIAGARPRRRGGRRRLRGPDMSTSARREMSGACFFSTRRRITRHPLPSGKRPSRPR